MSQVLESTDMLSPPSPTIKAAVVVRVPEMLLLPMVPPDSVRALAISASTQSKEIVPPSFRAVLSTEPAEDTVSEFTT